MSAISRATISVVAAFLVLASCGTDRDFSEQLADGGGGLAEGGAGSGGLAEGGAGLAGAAGGAACADGLLSCDGACVDPQQDPSHCGRCQRACVGGLVCQDGNCETGCREGFDACDGACVDLAADLQNCLACGSQCQPPASNGVAVCGASGCDIACSTGNTRCGDVCCDTAPANATASCQSNTCTVSCIGYTFPCTGQDGSPACGSWDFESGTTEGWFVSNGADGEPTDPPSAYDGNLFMASASNVASGTRALAMGHDADGEERFLSEIRVRLCPGGQALDLAGRTLKLSVLAQTAAGWSPWTGNESPNYFNTWNGETYVSGECDFQLEADTWKEVSCTFNDSDAAVTDVSLLMRVLTTWRGTFYFDDIRFE